MKRPIKQQFKDFANELIGKSWEAYDFDGAEIQSMAARHGLLEEVLRLKPCGENCSCLEYYDIEDFPVHCFRKTY